MAGNRTEERLVVDRYVRQTVLGRGGYGVVWRAHDTLLERDVAIKEIHFPERLDEAERARLREKVLREARAAARLSDPRVVTVFDVVEEDGRPLIVMALVDAPTLNRVVERDGPLDVRRAATVGLEALEALVTAHAHGIVHRDVKPANVMVHDSGRVQLADFGIASIIDDPSVTTSGRLAGSPSYMAPEQAEGHPAGASTDLWGLGATLYFAVEGEPPFEKDGAIATLASVVSDEPRPMRRAGALAPLIRDLLAKDPAARPSTGDVARRLLDLTTLPADTSPTAELDATEIRSSVPASAPADITIEHGLADDSPTPPPPLPPPVQAGPSLEAPEDTVLPVPPAPDAAPGEATPRPRYRVGAPLAVVAIVALVALVALVAGRAKRSPQANEGGTESAVPADWVSYQDPQTGFTVAHPPTWNVEVDGTLTDIRDPETNAYLRIDHIQPPGPSPEGAWRAFEPKFAAENQAYQRVQITPTTFKGHPAAIWEFTYVDRGASLHAVDLGFVTNSYGFALNFQTHAEDWERMQPYFEHFKESFKAPS